MVIRLLLLLLAFGNGCLQAQEAADYKFVDANTLTVLGRAAYVHSGSFHRVDSIFFSELPERVAALATNSAGICISFQTNSKRIKLKWGLEKYNTLWNMTPLAINGLDLYGWHENKWQYIASARPLSDSNEAVVIEDLDGRMRHYRLYLPLYSSLKSIKLGIDSSAIINKSDRLLLPKKKVVIYGSSITQGASASRPGMAYPSILSRQLNIETFNLGFSGSGKMELVLADVLGSMEADVYVLDCVPNPTPEEIKDRAIPFIKRLRQLKPDVPIIMVESIIREQANWSKRIQTRVFEQNREFRKAFGQLKNENYHELYYIQAVDLIGNDHEATIDGTHLTDLGFIRLADAVGKILHKLVD